MRVVRSWWNYWKWRVAWDTYETLCGPCHYPNTSQFTALSLPSVRDNITSLLAILVTPVSSRICVITFPRDWSSDNICKSLIGQYSRDTESVVSIMILYLQMSLTQNYRRGLGSRRLTSQVCHQEWGHLTQSAVRNHFPTRRISS